MNFFHMQVKNTPRIAYLEQVNINRSNNLEKQVWGCIVVVIAVPTSSLNFLQLFFMLGIVMPKS